VLDIQVFKKIFKYSILKSLVKIFSAFQFDSSLVFSHKAELSFLHLSYKILVLFVVKSWSQVLNQCIWVFGGWRLGRACGLIVEVFADKSEGPCMCCDNNWFLPMSKALLEKVWCASSMDIFASLGILTQAMMVTREIENQLPTIAHLLEEILWLGGKKQDVVSQSSTEVEYRAMAHTTCDMIWLKNLTIELDFRQPGYMSMHYDNQSTIYIAQNPVFHERTKHTENDCHLVRDAWTKKVVSLMFTPSSKKFVDLLTKASSPKIFCLMWQIGHDRYLPPAWGGVLE